MSTQTIFQVKVYAAVRKIPRGKVATYTYIARVIGKPRAARAVGNALNKNSFSPKVPCHRVVRSDFKVGGFARGSKAKITLLKKEGVLVERCHVGSVVVYKIPRTRLCTINHSGALRPQKNGAVRPTRSASIKEGS